VCRAIYVLDSLKSEDTAKVAEDFKSCLKSVYSTDDHHPEVVTYTPKVCDYENDHYSIY
jgi:hypothetical protein